MKLKIKLNLNLNSQVHCKFDLKSEILIYLYLKKEHIFKKNQKKKKKDNRPTSKKLFASGPRVAKIYHTSYLGSGEIF